jgi:hypothetical protein
MSFKLFDYLDPAIIGNESSEVRASKSPAAWPSEASAVRTDRSFFPIYGTCMRKAFYRMIGWPKQEEITADSPWKWVIGRAVEDKLTDLCVIAGNNVGDGHESLYVANGVKHYIRDLYLSIEMDVIARDPKTNRGWVIECKSYDGYFAEQQIEKQLKPKEENLIQLVIYLHSMKNGKNLKKVILDSLEDRRKLDGLGKEHRNRTEANLDVLNVMDDGPIGAKLVYISRGECNRTEFDIEIMQDVDGFHYPVINGIPSKIFTVESVFERFHTLQNYWFRARQAAYDVLESQGIVPPLTMNLLMSRGDVPADMTVRRDLTKDEWAAEKRYYEKLENAVRMLPDSYFPPPEYEWSYSNDRVRELGTAKVIGKTKFADWNAGKITRLGDWQCDYCPFAMSGCVAKQRPDLAYQLYDISNLPEDVEVTISGS